MPSIRKRHHLDGTPVYEVQVRVRGLPSRTVTFHSLGSARKWAAKTQTEMQESKHLPPAIGDQKTLRDAIDKYIKETLPDLAIRTRPTRYVHLKWWAEKLGDYQLSMVTAALISETRAELKEVWTNTTCNHYMASLSAVLSLAMKSWQWIQRNPCLDIPRFNEPKGRTRYLSMDEITRLLAACKASTNPFLYPAFVIALSTGLRRAELFGLTWNVVDLQRNVVYLMDTKNGDDRGVPLSPMAVEAFHIIQDLPVENSIKGRIWPDHPCNSDGYFDMRIHWYEALNVAGISDFRWHDIRHTCASYLAIHGANQRTVSEILGHHSLHQTARYQHLAVEHLRGVLGSVNQVVESSLSRVGDD